MYYKEIPQNLLAKLQKPLDNLTEEAVKVRLSQLFQDKWKSEFTHKQLFAITLPLIGPRGLEVITTVSLYLIQNTITIPLGNSESIIRTSYLICPESDEETRAENERLAFLNTAMRGLSIGVNEKTQKEISLEHEILFRKLFFSERVKDHNLDNQAIKVILSKEEAEPQDRRVAPRKSLPFFKSIPVAVTINRNVSYADIFPIDFSSSGLKLISSFNFPKDKPFTLTLQIHESVSLWCEVVWKNNLWEDLQHVGLKFVKLHLDKFEKLCRYFEDIMPKKEGDKDLPINRVLPVELTLWDQPKRLPSFIYSISSREIRIIHPSYLKENTKTTCRIFPFWNAPPIEGEVEIVSSHILKGGGCMAILEFVKISPECQSFLESFVQRCVMEERRSKER